jgi:hypothetical protein
VHPRFTSPRALFRQANRLVRRPSRVTLGAAAVTAVAAVAVIVGVSTGQTPSGQTPSGQANDLAAAAGHAGHSAPAHQPAHAAPAHQPAHGGPARTAHAAKQAPSNHQPSRAEAVSKHPMRHSAPARRQAPSHHVSPKPYLMYDSVMPSAFPAGSVVATYATGGYAVSPSQVAGHKTVVWIDTTATDPEASALDIEPGDATPPQAASWAWQRLHKHPDALARLYCSQSEWPAVQAAVASLPASMRSHIRWWIADPTGVPHLVPGSDATQWYWGSTYDLSTVTPRF